MRAHGLRCSTVSAAEPRHIVAGFRFHWSRDERWFQHEASGSGVEPSGLSAGGFGFQTKLKDNFLNQRRWRCWYLCRKKHMQVQSASLVLRFVLKSLLSLLFTSRYAMEAFFCLKKWKVYRYKQNRQSSFLSNWVPWGASVHCRTCIQNNPFI